MIAKLKKLLSNPSDLAQESSTPHEDLHVAAAALLVQVMRSDFEVSTEERRAVIGALKHRFEISDAEAEELATLAESAADGSVSLYDFTRIVHDSYDEDKKRELMEDLWLIAFSDRALEAYEEHTVRKLAQLLHVPHEDFIAAKKAARRRLRG